MLQASCRPGSFFTTFPHFRTRSSFSWQVWIQIIVDLKGYRNPFPSRSWEWLGRGRLKHIGNRPDLVRVHRQRQPAIATLDHRLASTDRLIDRIVYVLYGLSDDEIAIVEGTSGVDAVASP